MSEDAAMVELVPDVELGALVARLTSCPELGPQGLEQAAVMSDAAQQAGDYAGALTGAQGLLDGLVREIAYELRRLPNESVELYRARSRPASCARRHSRFLVHKRFLDESEAQNVQRAVAFAKTLTPESGVSLAAWSRLARQMVYAVADRVIDRYVAWRTGCSCAASVRVELVVFETLGDGSPYERAVCERCRCPRQLKQIDEVAAPEVIASDSSQHEGRPQPVSQVHGGEEPPTLPTELLHSPFRLVMTLLHGVRGEPWRDDGFDSVLPLPQAVADLVNELRRFEWVALPPAVEQSLREADKQRLMMVCVRSVALLHGLVAPQRALHRLRRKQKRQRQVERKRAALACTGGHSGALAGMEPACSVGA